MAATIPPGQEDVPSIDPEIMHGALCFRGTRMPLSVLLDNLADGIGADEFVEEYDFDREKVISFTEWQRREVRRLVNFGPED